MTDTYIIGSSPVPDWCRRRIMQYRKVDGTTGYEYHGKVKSYDLDPGDVLEKKGKYIYVRFKREMVGKEVL